LGSTKISYGSVTPPLIAADFLGRSFWENLSAGLPAGEALRRAKTDLATEMVKRQGYLDGEDQKTLISFVLYGDPLFMLTPAVVPLSGKVVIRRTTRPSEMKTACALHNGSETDDVVLDQVSTDRVRGIVAHYCRVCRSPMPAPTTSTRMYWRATPARRHRSDQQPASDAGTTVTLPRRRRRPPSRPVRPPDTRSSGRWSKLAVSR
jgi:hypothetical protein